MSKTFDPHKPCQFRDPKEGKVIRLLADLRNEPGVVKEARLVFLVEEEGGRICVRLYYPNGQMFNSVSGRDLINTPETHTRWLVWFRTFSDAIGAYVIGDENNLPCVGHPDQNGYHILKIERITYTEE